MEESVHSLNSRKRSAEDLDAPFDKEASAKRACAEVSSSSPHLALLEDLYDLEAEDEGEVIEAPLESLPQEDLVAEMMKSLEKVLEGSEGNSRGEGEASTSNPSGYASQDASPALDFTWNNDDLAEMPGAPLENGSCNEELVENAQIRQLLQASDDELGLPMSSSSSDLDESTFHKEWASLANEDGAPFGGVSWLDASFHQFEDGPSVFSKEVFEPLLLF